jgi:flagellar protein FliS
VVEHLTEEIVHQKTPQQLTSLLYETCIMRLEHAADALRNQRYIEANQVLQKCNDILYRLGAGINYGAGIVADQLEALYDYMARKLIEANINKDVTIVEEVLKLLQSLYEAWNLALEKGTDIQSPVIKQQSRAYDMDLNYNSPNVNWKE